MQDGCRACTTDCYRGTSIMLHCPVAIRDAFAQMKDGRPLAAFRAFGGRRIPGSIGAIAGHGSHLSRLAGTG